MNDLFELQNQALLYSLRKPLLLLGGVLLLFLIFAAVMVAREIKKNP